MALVGEATLDTPILAATVERIPGTELQLEEIRSLPDERLRFLVWIAEYDFDRFEAALSADETIEGYKLLTDVGDRRLYRLTLSEPGEAASTYLVAAAEDIVVLNLTVSADGIRVLARIPSREALRKYAATCQQRGVGFRLKRLYEEEETAGDGGGDQQFGLTVSQREVLRRALEMGYFDVPRKTSLGEIADELDVSSQALSTLLRRAQTNLLENTVGQ